MGVITDKQLQSRAGATDTWLIEDGPRGAGRFVARITPAGERLFYYRYTDSKGVRVRLPIGSFDPKGTSGLTLKAARARADQFAKIYLSGQRDLREFLETSQRDAQAAQAKARRDEEQAEAAAELEQQRRLTVRTLFDRWQSVELQPHLRADGKRAGRKDGGLYTKEQFTRHIFPTLGHIAAADTRKADVLAVLDALKAKGKLRTCNVLLADLKQMLRFALARDIIEKNVLDTVTKRDAGGADVERERVLTADELKALTAQIPNANMDARSAHAIWLIVATGCRVGELMGAKWKDVNTEGKSWYLPETKNERPHTIHLSEFAVGHFDAIANLKRPEEPLLPWVFPNAKGTGPVCPKSFGKQLADRQKPDSEPFKRRSKNTTSLQLKGGRWTAHDLRRTAATLMAQLGFSTDVIDECLNHIIQSRVSRIYIRDRREADQGKAFDALGARLKAITSGEATTN
jgi:integrase